MTTPTTNVYKLGEILLQDVLLEDGLITKAQLRTALLEQETKYRDLKLGEILMNKGLITEAELEAALDLQVQLNNAEIFTMA